MLSLANRLLPVRLRFLKQVHKRVEHCPSSCRGVFQRVDNGRNAFDHSEWLSSSAHLNPSEEKKNNGDGVACLQCLIHLFTWSVRDFVSDETARRISLRIDLKCTPWIIHTDMYLGTPTVSPNSHYIEHEFGAEHQVLHSPARTDQGLVQVCGPGTARFLQLKLETRRLARWRAGRRMPYQSTRPPRSIADFSKCGRVGVDPVG